jgi:hypothetical protein
MPIRRRDRDGDDLSPEAIQMILDRIAESHRAVRAAIGEVQRIFEERCDRRHRDHLKLRLSIGSLLS